LQALSARARNATAQLTAEGRQVRFVRSVFVPEDEACFHVYEATNTDDVREAASRAALPSAGIVEAISEQRVAR
jgi:hypothetical protein